MSKHTPGPWKSGINGVVKAGRYNVCPTVTAGGSSKGMLDERQVITANSRLISAAPDLLQAAMQVVDYEHEPRFIYGAINSLREAIKKALGDENDAAPT